MKKNPIFSALHFILFVFLFFMKIIVTPIVVIITFFDFLRGIKKYGAKESLDHSKEDMVEWASFLIEK